MIWTRLFESVAHSQAVAQTRGAANRYTVTITTETPGLYTAEVTVRDKYKAKGTFQVYSSMMVTIRIM